VPGTDLRGLVGAMAPLNSKKEERKKILGKKKKISLYILTPINKFFLTLGPCP
jgi:hypothetical protein